jgi:hypothetical protein
MKKYLKIAISCLFFIMNLTACSGSIDDSFFQVGGTGEGVVCIDGLYENPSSTEAKDIAKRLYAYYGTNNATPSTRVSARGFGATCEDYKAKPVANLTITNNFYETVIVPKTN